MLIIQAFLFALIGLSLLVGSLSPDPMFIIQALVFGSMEILIIVGLISIFKKEV